ncbi:hypothetical protein ACFHWD_07095 [Clostridium sp. MT-14]|jgi:hypothetical protein|uniref:Uncharacterized protein n=1 Tax=Clostridium aromativorans TaxID=2836848 RepID=A0ABS8N678_9CLOT|nr:MULTISPECIES: hypothetical protein [Clostridium]KAA8680132.1 hypothetical protein F3O63_00625 [Clostridium sp. HV4-5-A1G]MCC9294575.1 hypothetical protein [Clostridium aromativorans]CAB1243998.1 hypothetical protein CLOSBL3_10827 [Clostridiaceae bacterium BL-3]
MNFARDDNLKGNWNFRIPLVKQKIQDKVDIFRLNKDIKKGFNSVICIGNYDEMYEEIGQINLKK